MPMVNQIRKTKIAPRAQRSKERKGFSSLRSLLLCALSARRELRISASIALAAALTLLLMLNACQSNSTNSTTHSNTKTPNSQATTFDPNHPMTPDEAVLSDPCAARLHDIEGALMLYYALNKRLPDNLDQLRSMADIDTPLDFTCPVSHLPYVYAPLGLIGPGKVKRIIVYDPTPAHNGNRWCILMAQQERADAPQAVEVLSIPEAVFQTYLPVGGN
jgi:hypothetical protein